MPPTTSPVPEHVSQATDADGRCRAFFSVASEGSGMIVFVDFVVASMLRKSAATTR